MESPTKDPARQVVRLEERDALGRVIISYTRGKGGSFQPLILMDHDPSVEQGFTRWRQYADGEWEQILEDETVAGTKGGW